MKIGITTLLLPAVLALGAAPARAQEATSEAKAAPASFQSAADDMLHRLEESVGELDRLRERIAAEKIPLDRRLADLEAELSDVRLEYQEATRQLDTRALDLSNLEGDIKARREESTYLSNLLGDYIREFESRLHIAELQRYAEPLETAKLAPENTSLDERQVFEAQAALLTVSLERLEEALGGTRFEGSAVDASGLVSQGTFVLLGPAALFRSADGAVGTAETRLGSLEPTQIAFERPEDAAAADALVTSGAGLFPLDPTLGNAHKMAATEEAFWEWKHIQKGGIVMVPIFVLAGAALLVALYKWLALAFLRRPSRRQVSELLDAVGRHDEEAARRKAAAMKGPVGRMLAAGVEHLQEPRELIEEVMYETVLTTRLKLQRLLPFISVSAASAPLLGLLGTVTGIINTFKLITVFGSGDVKTLSGGISEALITTEYGLIVAIPSLLLHAFLSRKARGVVDQMEKAAVALVNQIGRHPYREDERAPELVAAPAPAARASEPLDGAFEEPLDERRRERAHVPLHERARERAHERDELDLEVAPPLGIEAAVADLERELGGDERRAVQAALQQLNASADALGRLVETLRRERAATTARRGRTARREEV